VYPAVLVHCRILFVECALVSSDNPPGAANQQERPGFEQWVVGFFGSSPAERLGSWNPQRPYASHLTSTGEAKIWSKPYGDIRDNLSEIPCRVSSDLHEWRNDLATVSTTDPAKLKSE
jgi:hypothetical protein